jgi:hypothetical protein
MKQNEMLLQQSLNDRSLRNNDHFRTTDHKTREKSQQRIRSVSQEEEEEEAEEEEVRLAFQRATKPREERPRSQHRTKRNDRTKSSLRPKSRSPTQKLPQTQTTPPQPQRSVQRQQQRRRREERDERSEWVGAVLDGGDLTDVIQLLETIDPMILQELSPSVRSRLLDSISVLMSQGINPDLCLQFIGSLMNTALPSSPSLHLTSSTTLSTLPNHTISSIQRGLDHLSAEPSNRGVQAAKMGYHFTQLISQL